MNEMMVYESLARSNLPASEKTVVGKWLAKLSGGAMSRHHVTHTAHHTVKAVRHGGEALITGGILGALAASKVGIAPKGVPLDLATAVVGIGSSVASAWIPGMAEVASDALQIGATGLGIYSFRRTQQLVAAKMGTAVHGESDVGADAILDVARTL